MEVINKMLCSPQSLLAARDLLLTSMVPPTTKAITHASNTDLPNNFHLLYPDLGPISPLSLLTNCTWSPMLLGQSAAATWLHQQQRKLLCSSLAQHQQHQQHQRGGLQQQSLKFPLSSQHELDEPCEEDTMQFESSDVSDKKKVSFTIDNIMNGSFGESRKLGQSIDPPASPSTSCSSSSRLSEGNMGGLKYECEVCAKTYSTFSGFTKHKQFYCTPQSKKQFNCKHCDKTYFSLGALKMHIRTHTLPCKCKVCEKAFSRPWLLQGHMRTHTGEKPFKCQHCGRAFADRSNLRAHLQTHSDIKKYSCKQCDKTFSRMSLLLKHEESSYCTVSTSDIVSRIFS